MGILLLLAALITSECSGCDEDEKRHVGSVVLNRMECPGFPSKLEDVIFEPGQFDGVTNSKLFYPAPENISIAADLIMHGSVIPETILYFYHRKNSKEIAWTKKLKIIIECKHHNFCSYANIR